MDARPPGTESAGHLLDLIKGRRSIRKFTSAPVPEAVVQEALEAAVWAPSACNQQAVRFVVLRKKSDIRVVNECKLNIANPQLVILLVLELGSEWYQRWHNDQHTRQNPILEAGAAAQNMALVFHSHGLASCWASLSPHINSRGHAGLLRRFRLADTQRITSALFVGYPAQTVDLDRQTHHRRRIRRSPVRDCLLEAPPRVLLLGGHLPTFDNLGSQALTAGMRRLIETAFRDSDRAFIEYPWHQPWPGFPSFDSLQALPDARRRAAFYQAVNQLVDVGLMLREDRSAPGRFPKANSVSRLLLSVAGAVLRRPLQPPSVAYVPGLNDPLIMGRCPPRPQLPDGAERLDDGWIEIERRLLPRRFLVRQCGSWLGGRHPRLAAALLRRQWRMISNASLCRLAAMAWTDVAFCDGDGALADAWDWSRKQAIRILAEWLAVRRLGAQTFVVNHSVSIQTPWLRSLLAEVYNQMDGVVVREPCSRQHLIDMGVAPGRILLGADAALCAPAQASAHAEELWKAVGAPEGAIALAIRGDMGDSVDVWAGIVRALAEEHKKAVVFICSSEAEDLAFARSIASRAPLRVIEGVKHYSDMIMLLRHVSVLVSSRYHPICFSMIAGTPFVPLRGNTLKTEGLMALIGYPVKLIESSFEAQCPALVRQVLERSGELKRLLADSRERLLQLAGQNVDVVEEMSERRHWIHRATAGGAVEHDGTDEA
ncbi:MAG TPA: nitroreductase family protein [Planctomycetota bacterium]|nr:nitroreductase family protein [Planctomycetota bacterium]